MTSIKTLTTMAMTKLARRLLAVPETPIAPDWAIAAAMGKRADLGDIESFAEHAAEESLRVQRIVHDLANLAPADQPRGSIL